jgi:hypothetical protein
MGYPVDLLHQYSTMIKSNSVLSTNTVIEDIYRDSLPSITYFEDEYPYCWLFDEVQKNTSNYECVRINKYF